MSYLALARKYRPRRFDEVMGQEHVVRALTHALDQDRLHPAILLTGTRGVGKTTLARIVAKGLNCDQGVSANACGVCPACREVDEGRSVDLLEIDAASNTGVDNIRELIENAQYSPARGRYKVYLIDEVHMLSKGAFNALLKTLEEPPPHVKFILATTDPQKLLVTVLSRCLQFNLKRLSATAIREQLAKVLEQEGVQHESAALVEIARAADGSMRDALSLLDQAIAFAGGQPLARAPVEQMLGTGGRRILYAVLGALAERSAEGIQRCIEQLEAEAPDYSALLNELAARLQRLAVLQLLPNTRSDDDDPELPELKNRLSPEDVQLYYQIAIAGRRDLPWAPDPRVGFEMTLLRMLAFRPEESEGPGAASGSGSGAARSGAPPPPAAAALRADASWEQRVDALGLEGFAKQLARNCAWAGREGAQVRLRLDPAAGRLLQEDRRAALERALSAQLGEPIELRIEVGAEPVASPAQLTQQRDAARQGAAEAAVENDARVRAFKEVFGAAVRPGSIQPLDS
jgi:DNA polymerase III subunit gamma/tau